MPAKPSHRSSAECDTRPGPALIAAVNVGAMSTTEATSTLGQAFAEALSKKDFAAIAELFHPEIDFAGLTPRRTWEAHTPDEVIQGVLRNWFEDSDDIQELLQCEHDSFADREHVGYRFRVRNPDGEFLVDQQAYLSERDGKIGWMRVLCAGYRRLD
jgi:hypothetical protein